MSATPIYVFDAHCVLCSGAVAHVLKYERRPDIRFVTIKSVEGREIPKRHNIDADNPKTFLFFDGGQTYDHSDAVFALMKHLDGPSKYLRWLRVIPRPLRDLMYRRIANNRYRLFGRTEACLVPSPQTRARFTLS